VPPLLELPLEPLEPLELPELLELVEPPELLLELVELPEPEPPPAPPPELQAASSIAARSATQPPAKPERRLRAPLGVGLRLIGCPR